MHLSTFSSTFRPPKTWFTRFCPPQLFWWTFDQKSQTLGLEDRESFSTFSKTVWVGTVSGLMVYGVSSPNNPTSALFGLVIMIQPDVWAKNSSIFNSKNGTPDFGHLWCLTIQFWVTHLWPIAHLIICVEKQWSAPTKWPLKIVLEWEAEPPTGNPFLLSGKTALVFVASTAVFQQCGSNMLNLFLVSSRSGGTTNPRINQPVCVGQAVTHTCVVFFFHEIWFIVYCFKVLKNRLKHVDLYIYTKFVWLSSMRIPMFVGQNPRDSQGALFRSWFFLLKIPIYDMYSAAPSTRTWTLPDCSSWDTKVRTEPTGWVMPPVDEHQGSKGVGCPFRTDRFG